jgi:hypothetical protein
MSNPYIHIPKKEAPVITRQFVYIMATPDNSIFHVVYCLDLEKAVKFYKGLPNMHSNGHNKLVYFEMFTGPECVDTAFVRFKELTSYPWELKAEIICNINPDLIELDAETILKSWAKEN